MSYLIWVKQNKDEMKQFLKEQFFFKRLLNKRTASQLRGKVYFSHSTEDVKCENCIGEVECENCRKLELELDKCVDKMEAVNKGLESKEGNPIKLSNSLERLDRKLTNLSSMMEECKLCKGVGSYKGQTGGNVVFKNGEVWDYKAYLYCKHQPKKYSIEEIESLNVCKSCGGKGIIPDGNVIGYFDDYVVGYLEGGKLLSVEKDELGKEIWNSHIQDGYYLVGKKAKYFKNQKSIKEKFFVGVKKWKNAQEQKKQS